MKKSNYLKPTEINERYNHYPGPFAIDEKDLEKIFPGISECKPVIDKVPHQKGDLDDCNLDLITKLVNHLQPKTIVELGTFRGRTTYNIAINCPKAKIITVDISDIDTEVYSGIDMKYHQAENLVGRIFKSTVVEPQITQIISDSLTPECQVMLDTKLKGQKIDVAFIDAGHDYDSVRHNFEELILPRLAPNGVVLFDDYNRPLSIMGVSHYLLEKAYNDGYVFYWYAPRESENTNEVIFLNKLETRCYNWRIH